ncbi:amidohydrolase family protein [Nocardia goodfellowii]|uniref:Amidohydrolase YtcJ n=1 Tax=Nocardia goodfellowii TaxID=882446 RepID=A0ABS4QJW5_9NOCA|nr:amidohydrolase family protein [Nocardia goodfellowii]MBP2191986.1 putative amidohydrolase YtcJ [Nocardia goodfellowii]
MLIRRARVFGSVHSDVRWRGGRIVECGTGFRPLPGEDDIDARGGWLLPGLHDHHIHLRALAARAGSVPLGPEQVADLDGLFRELRRLDSELPAGQWIRGTGYHESVAGVLDRRLLDRALPGRPIRIQHRSGALWMLNSAGCAEVDLEECAAPGVERDAGGQPTGRLWRLDSWLGERIPTLPLDLMSVSGQAARHGITGFTDATPGLAQHEVSGLAEAVGDGRIVQRVHCMAPPTITDPGIERFTLGPTKILLDDTTLPTLDDFTGAIRDAHAAGRPVAVHCVTRVQLMLTLAALDNAGTATGDRIEHGAIIPDSVLDQLRTRALTVVTQPHFPVERAAQYARDVPDEDRADLWRLGSLLHGGVAVAAGSDAPFGGPDPWRVLTAATTRSNRAASEAIPLAKALQLFFGLADRPAVLRTVTPGAVADLTLLRVAPEEIAADPATGADFVAATIVAGQPAYLTTR